MKSFNTGNVTPISTGLTNFINGLTEGSDYGKVNGYSKQTLLKPGAEKICQFLKLSIEYNVDHRLENWDKGLFHYELRVTLKQKDKQLIVTEGIGSCNSKEQQYAHQDPYTIVNTVLKMAKKRALVDAVLNVSATSGVFTQDIEDMPTKTEIKGGDGTISKQQLKKIHQLVKEQGMNPDTAREMMKMMFHVDQVQSYQKLKHHSSFKTCCC